MPPPERERERVLRFSLYLRVCIGCWLLVVDCNYILCKIYNLKEWMRENWLKCDLSTV